MTRADGLRGIDGLIGWQYSGIARKNISRASRGTPQETGGASVSKSLKQVTEDAARFLAGKNGESVSSDSPLSAKVLASLRSHIAAEIAEENTRAAAAPPSSDLKNAYGRAAASGKIPPFSKPKGGMVAQL